MGSSLVEHELGTCQDLGSVLSTRRKQNSSFCCAPEAEVEGPVDASRALCGETFPAIARASSSLRSWSGLQFQSKRAWWPKTCHLTGPVPALTGAACGNQKEKGWFLGCRAVLCGAQG